MIEQRVRAPSVLPKEVPARRLIVGIGASAGGLVALEEFFSLVSSESGIAYIVVQHLAPQHASMLTQLLGRKTKLPVIEAGDGTVPQPNHVYVIAPGTLLGISDGAFRVKRADLEQHGQIDVFLKSLAEDQGTASVGIILSGSGDDGKIGLRAIRDRGGLTVVQAPETAKYDSMPRNAIESGVVDQILPIDQMPALLIERAKLLASGRLHIIKPIAAPVAIGTETPSNEELLTTMDEIFELVREFTGHDFSHYKTGTVLRRLRHRIQEVQPNLSLSDYISLLHKDGKEADLLAKDLLIGVTQFFRDPDAFEYLGMHVLPYIIASKKKEEDVRIWIPGCASGEEAYSIGILMRERLAEISHPPRVKIFATDIDVEAIAEARRARYPAEIAQDITPERLGRFFVHEGNSYRVTKEVQEMCIFSEHSVIRDPPFLSLDLISCRNLLIYLDTESQKRLVPIFHYALKREGYLFLGSSEGLAAHSELFDSVEKKFRIFKRAEVTIRPKIEFPAAQRIPVHPQLTPRLELSEITRDQAISTAFQRLMLQEYMPAGAVVNSQGEIVCVVGPTGSLLQPSAGILTKNIFDIAHPGLRIELRAALNTATHTRRKVVRDDVHVELVEGPRHLQLEVRPLTGIREQGLYAVIFKEPPSPKMKPEILPLGETPASVAEKASVLEQMEAELHSTRDSLRATIEELESANADLKSSNEELLSTNEEMQSTNEELQSSQEELRSVNEELATINSEYASKVDELARANSDLQNLLNSTEVATLFLDSEQRITLFTPRAKALFRLIDADLGRSFADFAPRFAGEDLASDVREVIRTLKPLEHEVQTVDQKKWYLLRIFPYRTLDNVIAGAVVTLADITQIKSTEEALRTEFDATSRLFKIGTLFLQKENLPSIYTEVLDAAIAVTGADFGNIQVVDPKSGELKIVAHKGLPDWYLHFWEKVSIGRGACGSALERHERVIVEDVETSPIFLGTPELEAQRKADVRAVQATPLIGLSGRVIGIISTHFKVPSKPDSRALRLVDLVAHQLTDIIERVRSEDALSENEKRLRALTEASSSVIYRMSPDWTEMRELITLGFLAKTEMPNRNWLQNYIPNEEIPRLMAAFGDAIRNRSTFEVEFKVIRADGSVGWTSSRAIPILDKSGNILEWFGSADDLTGRKRGEELEMANKRLIEADLRRTEFLRVLSHELRNPLAPIRNSLYILEHAKPDGENVRGALKVVSRQFDQLSRLIDDLLDVTRVTSGKVELQRENLSLNDLMERVIEDYRGAFEESDVGLEFHRGREDIWVYADPTRLTQSIGNLLQNSVKFTERGGKTTVSIKKDESGKNAVVLVQDTGRGIAAEMLPRLFEPFTQADVSLDRKKGGLGLGLVIVKAMIEMHGGKVEAASPGLGRGSTFKITMPTIPPQPRAKPKAETKITKKRRRILIIEDNEDAAETLKEILELDGHEAKIALNGPDGIRMAWEFQPDFVICDIGLPDMNGYEVAQRMRADPAFSRIRLIVLTGYAGREDIKKASEAGFDDHIAKPPNIESLECILHDKAG